MVSAEPVAGGGRQRIRGRGALHQLVAQLGIGARAFHERRADDVLLGRPVGHREAAIVVDMEDAFAAASPDSI